MVLVGVSLSALAGRCSCRRELTHSRESRGAAPTVLGALDWRCLSLSLAEGSIERLGEEIGGRGKDQPWLLLIDDQP